MSLIQARAVELHFTIKQCVIFDRTVSDVRAVVDVSF